MVAKGRLSEKTIIGILDVHVHQAEGLVSLNSYVQQDVYARFLFGEPDPLSDAVLQTRTIKKGGSNPAFDQSLQIGVPLGEQILKCEVFMAQSRGKDQLIGFTRIPLHPIISGNNYSRKPTLYRLVRNHLELPAGTIVLTLGYHDIQTTKASASSQSFSLPKRSLLSSVGDSDSQQSIASIVAENVSKQVFKRKSSRHNLGTRFSSDDHHSSFVQSNSFNDNLAKIGKLCSVNFQHLLHPYAKPDFLQGELKAVESACTYNNLKLNNAVEVIDPSSRCSSFPKEIVNVDLGLRLPEPSCTSETSKSPEAEKLEHSHSVMDDTDNKITENHVCFSGFSSCCQESSLSNLNVNKITEVSSFDSSTVSAQLMELFPVEKSVWGETTGGSASRDQKLGYESKTSSCRSDALGLTLDTEPSPSRWHGSPTSCAISSKACSAFKPYSSFRSGGEKDGSNASSNRSSAGANPPCSNESNFSLLDKDSHCNSSNNCNSYSTSNSNNESNDRTIKTIMCIENKLEHPQKAFKRLKSFGKSTFDSSQDDSSPESRVDCQANSFIHKSKSEAFSCGMDKKREFLFSCRSKSFPPSHSLPLIHNAFNPNEDFLKRFGSDRITPSSVLDQMRDENSCESESGNRDQVRATAESHSEESENVGLVLGDKSRAHSFQAESSETRFWNTSSAESMLNSFLSVNLSKEKASEDVRAKQSEFTSLDSGVFSALKPLPSNPESPAYGGVTRIASSKFNPWDISLSSIPSSVSSSLSSSSSVSFSSSPENYVEQISSFPGFKSFMEGSNYNADKIPTDRKDRTQPLLFSSSLSPCQGNILAELKNVCMEKGRNASKTNSPSLPSFLRGRNDDANGVSQADLGDENEAKPNLNFSITDISLDYNQSSNFRHPMDLFAQAVNVMDEEREVNMHGARDESSVHSHDSAMEMMRTENSEEKRRMEWRLFWDRLQERRKEEGAKGKTQEKIFYGSRAFF